MFNCSVFIVRAVTSIQFLLRKNRSVTYIFCARDGSGYAAKRKAGAVQSTAFLFRRRELPEEETTAPDLQKPAFREPHLSG